MAASVKVAALYVLHKTGLGTRSPLLRELPKESRGAEIGVWRGAFSALLLSQVRPAHLTLIDPWLYEPRLPESWYGGKQAKSQADMDVIAGRVAARFARQAAAGQVTVLRAASKAAADVIPDGSLDWVYVDGDHTYEGVVGDLAAFAPKVRPGGLIAGDDYLTDGWWGDGVTRAVTEFIRCRDVVVVQIYRGQFLLRLPS